MQYNPAEEVTVWTNKVGPYHNPQETYDYYKLPFCKPNVRPNLPVIAFLNSIASQMKQIRHKSDSLGVILEGWHEVVPLENKRAR